MKLIHLIMALALILPVAMAAGESIKTCEGTTTGITVVEPTLLWIVPEGTDPCVEGWTFKPHNTFIINLKNLDEMPNKVFRVIVVGKTEKPLSVNTTRETSRTVITIGRERP
jgi:hypothetical protein